MAEFEQHLTIEQLSSFLDGELSANEQKNVEHHLALCQRCQQHLAELRLTVQLLHALPQPALPRSFILSLDTIIADPTPASVTPPIYPSRVQRPALLPGYLRPLRTLSTLAAVFGIVFLLSSVLPWLLFSSRSTMTASGSSTNSAARPASASGSSFDNEQLTQLAVNPRAAEKPSTATQIPSTPPPAYQPAQPDTRSVDTSSPTVSSLFDLSTLQGRATLGFLLLLLGILGLIFFKHPRRA